MADTTLNVTLTGSVVSGGTIELRQLVQFGDRLQKAVDRMAYAIEKQQGSRRQLNEVRTDTALRLVDTKKGSFVAELNFIRPPVLFGGYYDIATEAMTKLVIGLEDLRISDNGRLPEGYDQGVLATLQELGKLLGQGIESMEFDVKTSEGNYQSTYDRYTHKRIEENISEPEERIAAVAGTLLMANFRKDHYRCHIFVDDNNHISCTFDEDVEDEIDKAMRHLVNAIGIATINPINDEISRFHIKEVHILDEEQVPPQQLTELLDSYIEENDTFASFRRSWGEALAGETHPISSLWDDIDAG